MKTENSNQLMGILGRKEYQRFIEKDFLARLNDLVEQGKLDGLTARLVREEIEKNGELPCSVTELDNIICGRTVRGIGGLLEVAWDLPNGKKVKSFINTFTDEKRYEQAYLAQNFFHYLIDYVRENVDKKAVPGLEVSKPTPDKHKVLLSNFFWDGETVHNRMKTEDNAEEQLTDLNLKMKELWQYAEKYQKEVYAAMKKDGFKINSGYFEPVDYNREFLGKIILRINPELKNEFEKRGVLNAHGKINDKKLQKYLQNDTALSQILEIFKNDVAKTIEQGGQVISHRDTQLNNIIIDKNGTYHLIDFEWTGKDSPVSWAVPSLFKAEQYGVHDAVLEKTGYEKDLAGLVKAKDNLLWAGRYSEFSRRKNVVNPEEMKQLADYRFTKSMQEFRKLGLEETAAALAKYFDGKLKELPEKEMHFYDQKMAPMGAGASIIDMLPAAEVAKVSDIMAKRRRRASLVSKVALGLGALATLIFGGLLTKYLPTSKYLPPSNAAISGIDEKEAERSKLVEQLNDETRVYDIYTSIFGETYRNLKTAIIDKEVSRLPLDSSIIDEVAKKYSLDAKILRNMMEVNKYVGREIGNPKKIQTPDVNILDVFAAMDAYFNDSVLDPVKNLEAGAKRLRWCIDSNEGDLTKGLLDFYMPIYNDHAIKEKAPRWVINEKADNPFEPTECKLRHNSLNTHQFNYIAKHVIEIVYSVLNGLGSGSDLNGQLQYFTLKKPSKEFAEKYKNHGFAAKQ